MMLGEGKTYQIIEFCAVFGADSPLPLFFLRASMGSDPIEDVNRFLSFVIGILLLLYKLTAMSDSILGF